MDPTLVAQFTAGWANIVQTNHMENQRQARVDHAVLERMLIQGGDPANYADLQTGSHVPTPQPYVVPNFVTTAGKPVGA